MGMRIMNHNGQFTPPPGVCQKKERIPLSVFNPSPLSRADPPAVSVPSVLPVATSVICVMTPADATYFDDLIPTFCPADFRICGAENFR